MISRRQFFDFFSIFIKTIFFINCSNILNFVTLLWGSAINICTLGGRAIGDEISPRGRVGFAPNQAVRAGYVRETFHSKFTLDTVDIGNSKEKGFDWYLANFYHYHIDEKRLLLNVDSTITLLGQRGTANGQISTIIPDESGKRFIGTAFGGGGYFEACVRLDPNDVISTKFKGWPSFWALAAEGIYGPDGDFGDQWPGQPLGFRHNVEVDIFEFNDIRHSEAKSGYIKYGGALHDWYGVLGGACSGLCNVTAPVDLLHLPKEVNFNEFHRYGFLWVPATIDSKGFGEFYFDDLLLGRTKDWVYWDIAKAAPPPSGDFIYSVLDITHLALILGTGESEPMVIKSVTVWQRTAEENIVN